MIGVASLVDDYVLIRCGCVLHIIGLWENEGGRGATGHIYPCATHRVPGEPDGMLVQCHPGGMYARALWPEEYRPAWNR